MQGIMRPSSVLKMFVDISIDFILDFLSVFHVLSLTYKIALYWVFYSESILESENTKVLKVQTTLPKEENVQSK